MINVLQEIPSLDGGGVAKLLVEYYRCMDHSKIHFDFLIYDYYAEGVYEQCVKDMGCMVYKVPAYPKDKKGCILQIKELFKKHKYDVFHSHIGPDSLYSVLIAKRYGVKKIFVHSHLAVKQHSLRARILVGIKDFITAKLATQLFACGRDAGILRWGVTAFNAGKVKIMTNAIDTETFKFSMEDRNLVRKELNIEDKFVIGAVGRLCQQKNYPFLFKVLQRICESRSDAVLVVVGRGLDAEVSHITSLAKDMKMDDKILFLGIRNDVPRILNGFDVFAMPSLYEGLPVSLIEAQANGLIEVVSDRVTTEMNVTDLISFLPIDGDMSVENWSSTILNLDSNLYSRGSYSDIVAKRGYDIRLASKEMENFYLN